jgi:hypothetical protein
MRISVDVQRNCVLDRNSPDLFLSAEALKLNQLRVPLPPNLHLLVLVLWSKSLSLR